MSGNFSATAKVLYETAIGVVVAIDKTAEFQKYVASQIANKKVDVRIILDGVKKDFTINEFKERLGF